jgi:pantetheine-phosphate adenylyltransferase
MKKAVYPGTFDPLSKGHLDIIVRASKIFDEVHVLVSNNILKHPTFSADERVEMIKRCTSDLKNVVIKSSADLVVNYAKQNNIQVIIRGLRNYQDYEAEFSLYQFNKNIAPEIETLLMMPQTKHQYISSSAIKELITFGVDITPYVPKQIAKDVIEKFKK